MKAKSIISYTAAMILLSACGNTVSDRTLSGAGLGAGAGAVGGALVGGSVLTGAAIGTAAGAIGGALTDSKDVNLGRPLWRR